MKLTAIERNSWQPLWTGAWSWLCRLRRSERVVNASPELFVALDEAVLDEVRVLRKQAYDEMYPDLDLDHDPLDSQAVVFYTRSSDGRITSTGRLTFDGHQPLPGAEFLEEYRARNWRLAEWGRFVIDNGDLVLLKAYYKAMYTVARQSGCQAIVMAMKARNISMHQKLIGLKIIKEDIGTTYGGEHTIACVVWELNETKQKFFRWIGSDRNE